MGTPGWQSTRSLLRAAFGRLKNSFHFLAVDKDKRCAAERDSVGSFVFPKCNILQDR